MRTIDEIMGRIKRLEMDDFFGFERGVLAEYLPNDRLADAGFTARDEGRAPRELTEANVIADIREYLPFAFDKAINHRGLSAGRSVNKMSAWVWLLGNEELTNFIQNNANYRNYGVPILKRVAAAFGIELPDAIAAWEDGMACEPGCDNGCGQ